MKELKKAAEEEISEEKKKGAIAQIKEKLKALEEARGLLKEMEEEFDKFMEEEIK